MINHSELTLEVQFISIIRDGDREPGPLENQFQMVQSTGIVCLQTYQLLLSMFFSDTLKNNDVKLISTRRTRGEEE